MNYILDTLAFCYWGLALNNRLAQWNSNKNISRCKTIFDVSYGDYLWEEVMLSFIPYLKKIQKLYRSRDTSLEIC